MAASVPTVVDIPSASGVFNVSTVLAERRCWHSCCCWLLDAVDFSSLAGLPALVNAPAVAGEPVAAVVSDLAVVPASQTF